MATIGEGSKGNESVAKSMECLFSMLVGICRWLTLSSHCGKEKLSVEGGAIILKYLCTYLAPCIKRELCPTNELLLFTTTSYSSDEDAKA